MTTTEAGSSHTNWSLIFDAARGDPLPASTALERLVRRYWPAVYAFIRQSGCGVDEASDLTQGFICDVILDRNLFKHADPKRGRFRSLLLTSLSNYLKQKHRFATAGKRSPPGEAGPVLRLNLDEVRSLDRARNLTPEQAFSLQWHATMLREVLERVREECMAAGLEAHWRVFEGRIVRPMLLDEPRVSYAKLIELLDLTDAGQAANMMVTVKRRFVQALIQEVRGTVTDPEEIEEEIQSLLREVEAQR
jgi:DNA-directed RNA polymerase specialized sigma24 family protein